MMIGPSFLVPKPYVPLAVCDFSGEVLDGNGTGFMPGDSVYGCVPSAIRLSTRQGALSKYIRVPSSCLVKRPSNITPIEAAEITLAVLTSYQALHHIANVEPEQTIFKPKGLFTNILFRIFRIRNIMPSTTLWVSPILLFSLGVRNTWRLMESLFPTIHFPKIFQWPNYGKG